MQAVTDSTFDEMSKSGKPVVLFFWNEGCEHSTQIAPALEEISKELESVVEVKKVHFDQNSDTAKKLNVQKTPAIVLHMNGENKATFTGEHKKQEIKDWIHARLSD